MASFKYSNICITLSFIFAVIICISCPVSAQLNEGFYAKTCPSVFDTVKSATRSVINRELRMGASLLRLLFHDCFVSGCDGGILLEDFGTFVGEQNTRPNKGGIRGYSVIADIKKKVDVACGASVVSCADVLVIATRDSVVELGGPTYSVPLGRRDAKTANPNGVSDLVGPEEPLESILKKFDKKGLTPRDTVALSGAHTIGQGRCVSFRERIYNATNIDPEFANSLKSKCPRNAPEGDANLAPLDPQSPNRFGNNYFQALTSKKALLNSDQVLYNGGSTDSIVTQFSSSYTTFLTDFATAMVKMGNISPLTGTQGEIRTNCLRVNV